ncbi:MAG: MarR family transcriptional regulator [Chloroflexi bacterium]|nr:MarR family transcriptional regulator [Chloroflexota bacterium]
MDQIEACISFLLGKAYQQVNASAKRRLQPHGVTPVQYAVLNVLWQQDAQSGAALGERLQLDSATMTGVLDRLVGAGLVERQADPLDRRVNRVVLTGHGRSLQQPLDREMDALNAEIFGQLGDEDADHLRAILRRLGKPSQRV